MENTINQIGKLSTLSSTIAAATTGKTTAFHILLSARLNDTGKQLEDITVGELAQVIADTEAEFNVRATA